MAPSAPPTRTAGKCSIYSKLLPPVVYGQSSPRPSLSAWQSCPWYWGVQRLGFFLIGGIGLWTPKMIRVRTFVLKGTVYCWNLCRGQLHVIVICKKTKIIARYIYILSSWTSVNDTTAIWWLNSGAMDHGNHRGTAGPFNKTPIWFHTFFTSNTNTTNTNIINKNNTNTSIYNQAAGLFWNASINFDGAVFKQIFIIF